MQRGGVQGVKPQEELYACYNEPDPDYQNDDGDEEDDDGRLEEFPTPPPPITAEELSAAVAEAYDTQVQNGVSPTSDAAPSHYSKDPPQIMPKPLANPCLESKERQALHRELLMNYKIGKDVLKKPELNKVMRDRREKERQKEWDQQKSSKGRTSLELKLEERAKRMKEEEDKKMNVIKEDEQGPELMRVHRKITLKSTGSADKS